MRELVVAKFLAVGPQTWSWVAVTLGQVSANWIGFMLSNFDWGLFLSMAILYLQQGR